jgi:hypothetical protein
MNINALKTGWKTTEFWVSLVPQVLGVLLVLGIITPEQNAETAAQANVLVNSISQGIGAVIAALAAYGYSGARAKVKEASIMMAPQLKQD